MEQNTSLLSKKNADMEQEDTIDLLELFAVYMDHIWMIITCVLVCALLVSAYSYFGIRPTYEATAKLYVVSASSDSVVNLSDLNIGTNLTEDYEELMMSYPVLEEVISDLDLDMDTKSLSQIISIQNPSNTRVLWITATTTNPELSQKIANKLAEVSVSYLPEVMSTNAPNIAQQARLPESKAGPSYMKYTMIGAVLGAFICLAYITIRYLLDDTIHTADDMEAFLDMVPLTSIPENASLISEEDLKKKRRKGGKKA